MDVILRMLLLSSSLESDSDSFNDVEEIVDDLELEETCLVVSNDHLVIHGLPVFEEQDYEEVPVQFEISPENEMEDILEAVIETVLKRVSNNISQAIIEDLMSSVNDKTDREQHCSEENETAGQLNMAQKPINFEQFDESFVKEKEFWKNASETLDDDEYNQLVFEVEHLPSPRI